MKNVWMCFIICWSLSGFGQISKAKPDTALYSYPLLDSTMKPPPIYTKYNPDINTRHAAILIDSVNFNFPLSFIDAKDIFDIHVLKDKKYPYGALNIILKDHKLFLKLSNSKILSLRDITDTYVSRKERHKPIIFLVDKKLITDTAGVRIPKICLGDITVAEAAQMPYFKTTFPKSLIMMISTTLIGKSYQPEIILR